MIINPPLSVKKKIGQELYPLNIYNIQGERDHEPGRTDAGGGSQDLQPLLPSHLRPYHISTGRIISIYLSIYLPTYLPTYLLI